MPRAEDAGPETNEASFFCRTLSSRMSGLRRLGLAGSALLVLGLAGVLAGAPVLEAAPAAGAALPNFDIQKGRRGTTLSARPGGLAALNAAAASARGLRGAAVQYDALTRMASRVSHPKGKLTGLSGLDAEQIARNFLVAHPELYGQTAEEVAALEVVRRCDSPDMNVTHLSLGQQVGGLPVFKSEVKFDITFAGEILATSGTLVPGLARTVTAVEPRLSPSQALALAMRYGNMAGAPVPAALHTPSGPSRKVTFVAGPGFERQPEVELVYFAAGPGRTALAWDTTLWQTDDPNVYHILVDATTGQLLFRNNYTCHAQGQVFDKDSPQDGTPVPMMLPPPVLPRVVVTFDGGRLFNGTPLFPPGDVHRDWWNTALRDMTATNNVLAGPGRDMVFPADPMPVGPTGGTSPNTDFNHGLDLTMQPSTYTNAAVVNVFYWNNRLHDIWYRYGFTEAAGNFQVNNFSLGGLGNDRVRALVQFGANTGFSNDSDAFTTPPDGLTPTMRTHEFTFTNPRRDSSLENDILIHEYGHGVTNRLVGNANGLTDYQPMSLGEGWSDFQALIVLAEATDDIDGQYPLAGWLINNFPAGIRSEPYSTNVTSTVFTKTYSNISGGQIHTSGEIICNALWQSYGKIYNRLGFTQARDRMMRLFIDMLKLLPNEPTFLDCRDRLILADLNRFGGEDVNDIWAAFASRGMGVSATTSGSDDMFPVEAFDVPFGIMVTYPNGGEVQVVGTNEPITWTADNPGGLVKIEYSLDGGTNWIPIYPSTENDGFAIWTVQGPDTGLARIRVSDLDDANVLDASNSTFSIASPAIQVLFPNGGETLINGNTVSVQWLTTNFADAVKIDYSTNGGASWIPIYSITDNDGVALWTVPTISSTQALVRVVQASNPARFDTSNSFFTIQTNVFTVTSPNGGEIQQIGTNQPITWVSASPSALVRIDYSNNAGASWIPIYLSTENDGFALWTVQGPATTQARIRVSAAANQDIQDASDSNFIKSASSPITVTYPNGGESLIVGINDAITWTSTGLAGNVRIDYSTNGGVTWNLVAGNTANDGNHPWTIPGPVSAQALVRVSSVTTPTLADVSNNFFTMRADQVLHFPSITDAAIPDNNVTGIEAPLLVSGIPVLRAVHIAVNITHPDIGELEVSIVHPDGTAVKLHNQTGSGLASLVTKYPIFTAAAEDLSVLNGKPMGGTWKLRVKDLVPANAGRLNAWTLTTVF
jgi:extracellular elastinolytic metalloproteinase